MMGMIDSIREHFATDPPSPQQAGAGTNGDTQPSTLPITPERPADTVIPAVPPLPASATSKTHGSASADTSPEDAAAKAIEPIADTGLVTPMLRWLMVTHGAQPEAFDPANDSHETNAPPSVSDAPPLPPSYPASGDNASDDDDNSDGFAIPEASEFKELDERGRWDADNQLGQRVRTDTSEAYYPNLVAFVECYFAHMFPYMQSVTGHIQWIPDWWKHPPVVGALDALWRAYEMARRQPGQMMVFQLQAYGLIDRVFDKDRGIVASLGIDATRTTTDPGQPLPCVRPPRGWRQTTMQPIQSPRQAPAAHSSPPRTDFMNVHRATPIQSNRQTTTQATGKTGDNQ